MSQPSASASERWYDRDRPVVLVLCVWLAVVFGLVWNPWWMPSGDAEVFVVVARNLVHGDGLSFNGHPIAFIPPGWPLVLAGLLQVTDQYLWLKAVQIFNMAAFLLLSFLILRHFVGPRVAGLSCGLAGILWPLYPLTMWLHSDAFFCAIAAATGLLAVAWGDGRIGRGWLLAVLMGCALGVVVRWAALVQVIVIASLLCGSGRAGPAQSKAWLGLLPRHWIGIALAFVATLGTFVVLKQALSAHVRRTISPSAAVQGPAATAGGGWLTLARIEVPEEVIVPDLFVGREDPDLTPLQELAHRALATPQWVSWTLFFPLRVVDNVEVGGFQIGLWFDRAVGLLAMTLVGVAAWRGPRPPEGRRPHFLWLGVLVYIVALSLNWPHVNNRYLVPISPLLIAGVLVGLAEVSRHLAFRILRWSFVAALLAINGSLWAVDVFICRSASAEVFYGRWEAGIYQSLIEVGVHLDSLEGIEDGQIVASERYQNLNERWEYPLSPRAIVLMTGKQVRSVPTSLTGAGVKKAQSWARETGTVYYVQQNPTYPGRIWHFRVTPELEETITGWLPAPERPQFELFVMLPDPIPQNPDLQSLKYYPVPVLQSEALEQVTRRVPKVRD